MQCREIRYLAILDCYKVGTLGAGFPDMPALKVARKHDMRMLVKDLRFMDVAQRPIVVSLGHQLIERARGVGLVLGRASECGMQYADIERAGHGIGIAGYQIVGYLPLPEALPVQRNLQFIEDKAVRLACGEDLHVIWQTQTPGDLTFSVMVAVKDERTDAGLGELAHLVNEEQARVEVAPVTVIKITGYDDEGDLLVDRLSDEIVKGFAGRRPDSLRRRSRVSREPYERAVDMNIRGVDEAKGCHVIPKCIFPLLRSQQSYLYRCRSPRQPAMQAGPRKS